MNPEQRSTYVTRDMILNTLSDAEIASVSSAETAESLAPGDEYLDLSALSDGVRTADAQTNQTPMALVLPRKAVQGATWTKILSTLVANTNGAGS